MLDQSDQNSVESEAARKKQFEQPPILITFMLDLSVRNSMESVVARNP